MKLARLVLAVGLTGVLLAPRASAQFTNINANLPGVGWYVYGLATAWGDFDNDGRLDLVLAGSSTNYPAGSVSQVWRNLGGGTFSNFNAGLPGANNVDLACADFDGDGYLDLAIAGYTGAGTFTQIWRNTGNGTFTNIDAGLPNTWQGSIAWADFDNDGRPDLLLTGLGDNASIITQIWRNRGDGTFTNLNANLPGIYDGAIAVGDFDNDGYPDILLTGFTNVSPDGSTAVSQLWRNLGNGKFTNMNLALPGVAFGSVAFADFNNDGRLDILLTGDSATGYVSQVWLNQGNGTFSNLPVNLPAVAGNSSVAVGDYDNDGWPDILISGLTTDDGGASYHAVAQVWRNQQNGTFADIGAGLPGINGGSVGWADYNNDGRLDFLLAGYTNEMADTSFLDICQVWQNYTALSNSPPVAPGSLTSVVAGTGATLSWSAASDAQTPSIGLTYNVRVGSSPGGGNVLSPLADPLTGWRRVAQPGSAGERLFALITNLTHGATYYWSVQAVDTAFAGGPFATEASFTIPAIAPSVTTLPSTTVAPFTATFNASVNPNGAASFGWFRYGPDTNYGSLTPPINLGAGGVPTAMSAAVSNLLAGATYHVQAVASNALGTSFGADVVTSIPSFGVISNLFPALQSGSLAWGDYDNDGKLDLLIIGAAGSNSLSQVWKNLGNGVFSNINAGLPGVSNGAAAWGDLYNDGRLDIVLTGSTGSNYISQIWRNLGNGGFSNINAGLPGVGNSAVALGDYDNDGKLDILLSGNNGTNFICQLWRNSGNGVFQHVATSMPGVSYGSLAWGDFDNDGYLDILLTGSITEYSSVSQVWRNLGNGTFSNTLAGLPGVSGGSAVWGDFNNDGYPDILLAGSTATNPTTQVWRNRGNGTFTNIQAGLPALSSGVASWGDFNNDGLPDILLAGGTRSQAYTFSTQPFLAVFANLGGGSFSNMAAFPNSTGGSGAWGDFDGNGSLDIAALNVFPAQGSVGYSNGPVNLWRNDGPTTNTPPSAPTLLSAVVQTSSVRLQWAPAADAQTPSAGLSYNARVGTTPGGVDILSPESNPGSGLRLLPAIGNAQERLTASLTNLPAGTTFYWSVQAIDASFAGSPFAAEQTFVTLPLPPRILRNSNFGFNAGSFGFDIAGQSGWQIVVQTSTDLSHWVPVWTNTLATGSVHYNDPQAGASSSRYYRVMEP